MTPRTHIDEVQLNTPPIASNLNRVTTVTRLGYDSYDEFLGVVGELTGAELKPGGGELEHSTGTTWAMGVSINVRIRAGGVSWCQPSTRSRSRP